ncbi:o-succinylbenzoate synthase [Brachybacterium saurashtrense]|uniref:o-succinylbenzoate synthase n=1 Tax=Brachybacterium saurashtrense TaxID=556288 RepID=A0A345YPI0_9MICO|nr:o-succinylbenzoate synthase [Brachybacterium saurashtrense]AXK45832.1 O-succinylbenzoate synthase [Brachybacterium saurashtrense]RRR24851.1 O-succinylbenzoate synthase [Brachybacterium saurashtrense]
MRIPTALAERGIDRALAWSIPMTTRFRRITERDGVLLHGPEGWAEFSPFWDYDAAESAAWLAAALEDATVARPAPQRTEIEINATIPVLPPVLAHRIARVGGARTAKVKVADPGSSLAEDAERLEAVRDALGPAAQLRIDANGAWSLEEALAALPVLERAAGGLEYAEQPCASLEDLSVLRRRVEVPIAADESVRRAEDPLRVARAEAADVLVMKVQPLGGVRRCVELAEQAGLPVVVSSALESSVGLSAGLALAAALPTLTHACGLGTANLLTGDLVEAPLHPEHGVLPVTRQEPAPELLERHAAGAELTARWEERLAACAAQL